jgi:hypothetical protein
LAVSLCAFAAEYAPLSSGWSSFSCGRRPGEHQTAATGAESDPMKMSVAAGKRIVAPATKPARRVF